MSSSISLELRYKAQYFKRHKSHAITYEAYKIMGFVEG